jgi:hypothetical protein
MFMLIIAPGVHCTTVLSLLAAWAVEGFAAFL